MKAINNRTLRGFTLISLFLASLWLSGCQRSDDFGTPTPETGSDVQLTFRVCDASDPGTYTSEEGFSDKAFDKDLVALIFMVDIKTNSDGLLRYQRFRKVTTKTANGVTTRSILLPATLIGKQFTLVLCANAKGILGDNPDLKLIETVDNLSQPRGLTYEQLVSEIALFSPNHTDVVLPMWGKIDDVTIASQAEKTLGDVVLLRSLCRVDVGLHYPETGEVDDQAEGLDNFLLKKVYIARSKDKAQLIPNKDNYTYDKDAVKKYDISAPSVAAGAQEVPWVEFTPKLADISCQEMIFLPEQPNSTDEDVAPCVILEGTYTFPDKKSSVTGFYRVDYIDTRDPKKPRVDLLRGHLVRFNITAVKGPGYKSKEEARDSKPINIDVTLDNYTVFNSNTIFDGQYHFTLNKKEVTLPRETGIQYTLPVNTNIPLADWKMHLGAADATGSGDAKITNGHFEVTKAAGTSEDSYTLTIRTTAPWDATTAANNEDILYIDAKRLKIQIPLHQIDQSAADWQAGNATDDELDGSLLSKSAFFFPGGVAKEKLQVFVGGSGTTYTVSYEDEGGVLPVKPDWLTVTQKTGTSLPAFDFSVTLNELEKTRKATVVLTEEGAAPDKQHVFRIPVLQNQLLRGDLLDPVNAVLWRDRNLGAASSAADDSEFTLYESDDLIGRGRELCPVGWVLPGREDFQNLANLTFGQDGYSNSGLLHKILRTESGVDYILFHDGVTKMFFQPRGGTGLNDMYYWFVKEPHTRYDDHGGVKYTRTGDQITGAEQALQGKFTTQVRCVRKLTIDRNEVNLSASGETQYINLSTLENGEVVNVKFEKSTDEAAGFFVRQDNPTRLAVGRITTNLTGNPINGIKVTISGTRFPNVTRTLTINQKAASSLVDDSHPFVTIGDLEWYGKNVGATSFDNGYLHYRLVESPNESVNSGGRSYETLNDPANTNILNSSAFGTTLQQGAGAAECQKIGSGWRLPSPLEWRTLLARTRIVEGDLTQITTDSKVKNNKTKYPIYVVDDGQYRMYLPMGQAITGINSDTRNMPVRAVSYHTSVGIGSSYTHVHLSRYLYGDKEGSSYSYLWPWGDDFLSYSTYAGTHMASTVNYVTVIGYVRCVRNKQ